jgi:hypothetical protein
MARSGGPQDLGNGIEAMIPMLPRANVEDGTARALRSILHREMTGKITPRSAQMAMERLVPKLEPARIQPTIRLDDASDPLTPASYDDAMGAACRAMCEGRISPAEARAAMIVIKTRWRARLETDGAR